MGIITEPGAYRTENGGVALILYMNPIGLSPGIRTPVRWANGLSSENKLTIWHCQDGYVASGNSIGNKIVYKLED